MSPTGRVRGTIDVAGLHSPLSGVSVYVRLEDVSRADAVAPVVAQQVMRGVNIGGQSSRLTFEIPDAPRRPDAEYGVRVHVDVDGDGQVSVGDFTSTQSYRVKGASDATFAITVSEVL